MKRLAVLSAAVLGTILGAVLFWRFRGPVVLLLLALAVAAAVRPLIDGLRRARLPKILAVLIPYLGGLAAVGVLGWFVGQALADELPRATTALANAYERFRTSVPDGTPLRAAFADILPPASALGLDPAALQAVAVGAWGVTIGVIGVIGSIGIVLGLSAYWVFTRESSERAVFALMPPSHRATARAVWLAVSRAVGEQVRAAFVMSLVAALVLAAAFYALRLEFPMLPSVFAALARIVPLVGAPLAVAAAAAAGLADGVGSAIAAAAITAVTLLGVHLLVGRMLLRTRRFSAILLVLLLVVLGEAVGVVGLVFAPALAAAVQVFFGRWLALRAASLGGPPALEDLQRRVAGLRAAAAAGHVSGSPEAAGLLGRLEALVAEARRLTEAAAAGEAGP